MSLLRLPDELWKVILNQWIDKVITLCGVDIAFCDRLLRERYMHWLQSAAPGTMFANIMSFETIGNVWDPSKLLSNSFFVWCLKRKIYPKVLSMHFDEPITEVPLLGDLLQQIEVVVIADAKYGCCYRVSTFHNLLLLFPKVKELKMLIDTMLDVEISLLILTPSLIRLELNCVSFMSQTEIFETWIRACPMLEEIKLVRCREVKLQDIGFMIGHAAHLQFVYFELFYAYSYYVPEDDNVDSFFDQLQSLSMKRLVLILHSSTIYNVCSILNKCPYLEEVSLDHFYYENEQSTSRLAEIIGTCWKHLITLKLQHGQPSLARLLPLIASTCSPKLKHLYIPQSFVSNEEMIVLIANSFPLLETFVVCDGGPDPTFFLESLANAVFCQTLQTLKLSRLRISPHHIASLLITFPALKSFDLTIANHGATTLPIAAVATATAAVVTTIPQLIESQITSMQLSSYDNVSKYMIQHYTTLTHRESRQTDLLDEPPLYHQVLDLSGYSQLQELTLQKFYLYPIELSNVLTLPCLHSLTLFQLRAKNNIILFRVDSYPASGLAPLKSLSLSGNLCFTDMKLRTLLDRFPSLEELKVSQKRFQLPCITWLKIKHDYRYRVHIMIVMMTEYY